MDKRVENGTTPKPAPALPLQTEPATLTPAAVAQQRTALQMGQLLLEVTRLQAENEQLRAALAAREA